MKIAHSVTYLERDLYILEINGKFIQVYRSSGLSGTNQKGKILPFMFLNETHSFTCILGYIFKEMLYNNKVISHHKNLTDYPKVQNLMTELENLEKPTNYFDTEDINELIDFIKEYNNRTKEIVQNNWFDFKDL